MSWSTRDSKENYPMAERESAWAPPVADQVGWDALDVRTVDTVRLLAVDAVQKVAACWPVRPHAG
jgi:transketolase